MRRGEEGVQTFDILAEMNECSESHGNLTMNE